MTDDQAAAIYLYTQDTPVYRILNSALRERNRAVLLPFFPYLRLLLSALHCLPALSMHVYRGVRGDYRDKYVLGKEFVWWACTSTTANLGALSNPMFLGKDGHRTKFAINTHCAFDIRQYSAFSNEDERLIYPGTKFRVDGVLDCGHGLFEIQLTEVISTVPYIDFTHPQISKLASALSDDLMTHSLQPVSKQSSTSSNTETVLADNITLATDITTFLASMNLSTVRSMY